MGLLHLFVGRRDADLSSTLWTDNRYCAMVGSDGFETPAFR
jgi:hypothetical protein